MTNSTRNWETLDTDRLSLRILTPEILDDLFATQSDEDICRELGISAGAALETERLKARGGYKTYDRTMIGFIMVKKDDGTIIGRCGFHNWYAVHRRAELGYVLFADTFKRKGYMTEAVAALLDYGFTVMGLNRVEAFISPSNEASLCVVRKFGFRKEGHFRQHFNFDGQLQDSVVFALLKEDFAH